jgi:hypothetical protein
MHEEEREEVEEGCELTVRRGEGSGTPEAAGGGGSWRQSTADPGEGETARAAWPVLPGVGSMS